MRLQGTEVRQDEGRLLVKGELLVFSFMNAKMNQEDCSGWNREFRSIRRWNAKPAILI